jgi:surface polysaccharide O-acyltransferase-like enzyme
MPTRDQKVGFLSDIHRMRGMAILLIVATHCLYFFHWTNHHWLEDLLLDLFDDSTIIFVFITGYLFRHGRDSYFYLAYLRTKFRNVILPYLLISTPAIVLALRPGSPESAVPALADLTLPMKVLYLYIWPGLHTNYALWFIPILTIFYFVSPLLHWMSFRPRTYLVLVGSIPLSILMHRPTYGMDHNLLLALYFLPAYILGMWCREKREWVQTATDRYFALFCGGFLTLFLGHFALSEHHGKYTFKQLFDFRMNGWLDWIFMQKLLLIPVLLGLAWRIRNIRIPALEYLANLSFTIYFLHVYVIFAASYLIHWRFEEVNLVDFILLMTAAVLVPSIIGSLIHKLAPTSPLF